MPFPLAKVPPRSPKIPFVLLSIAGFDPSGGAGILADLKTFAALGAYGMACITAMTIQSTQGVCRVFGVDVDIVRGTLDCLAADASFACIKVGMLGSGEIAGVVLDWLNSKKDVPVVLDPVVKSSSCKDLLDISGRELLATRWLGRAQWITPNFAELADLSGCAAVSGRGDVEAAATKLLQLAAAQGNPGLKIVATGGESEKPEDVLLTERELRWFTGERIVTTSTHGTGCAFSSALAARIAMGDPDSTAVQAAKDYVTGALRHGYPMGRGNGPPDHFWERPVR